VPVDHWYDKIGNPTLADGILDRLVHNATASNSAARAYESSVSGYPRLDRATIRSHQNNDPRDHRLAGFKSECWPE
jgi:hypothetical protein